MQRRPIHFASAGERLAGEVVLPAGPGPHPAVLLVGGTISDTRDGDPAPSLRGEMPQHGMLRVMAEHLAAAGLGSLRWDKRGVGESTGRDRDSHSDVWTDVEDAEQAFRTLRGVAGVDPGRIAVLGESAGAYFACFLAARARPPEVPAAYVLQGALYSSIPELMAFNYQRVADYCARGPEAAAWVRQVAPGAYRLGQHWDAMIEAARRGEDVYQAGAGQAPFQAHLRRFRQELEFLPAQQFRHIQGPALVIQGDRDMNVPPEDCYRVAQALRQAGNAEVTLVVVPGADHSMQLAPDDLETRLRERISLDSFRHPYSEFFLNALADWLSRRLGSAA